MAVSDSYKRWQYPIPTIIGPSAQFYGPTIRLTGGLIGGLRQFYGPAAPREVYYRRGPTPIYSRVFIGNHRVPLVDRPAP